MKETIDQKKQTFQITSLAKVKEQLFHWAQSFDPVCYLDSNAYGHSLYRTYEGLLAVGQQNQFSYYLSQNDPFEQLRSFHKKSRRWLFGYLSYDLKNKTEKLSSQNPDYIQLPEMHFFQPVYLIKIFSNQIEISSCKESPAELWKIIQAIPNTPLSHSHFPTIDPTQIKSRISKADYLKTIMKIKDHLLRGDIYEMNFCQEFYLDPIDLTPASLFDKFNKISQAPFSAFYRLNDKYLLCASPERFLKKEGQQLISQPIKGTIKRGKTASKNKKLTQQLLNSKKDRSENVMIVDLVRNDLSRSCVPGSVQVKELFGIYPFAQVNHLISTVTGTLAPSFDFVDALKNAFPMGSMTGAPKIRSMELIEMYEQSKRGLYSGAVGYITPEGDFDFNVVIRSMLYDADGRYLSFQVGGAIVINSVPELEYAECLLKVAGIRRALCDGKERFKD